MNDCLICKIIAGEIPSAKVYEDEHVYAFRDINPQAPTHILVVPKEHIGSAAELTEENSAAAARCLVAAAKIAEREALTGGYRIVSNVDSAAGQTVKHIHFHILGGKRLDDTMELRVRNNVLERSRAPLLQEYQHCARGRGSAPPAGRNWFTANPIASLCTREHF